VKNITTSNKQQATSNKQQATSNKQQATCNPQLFITFVMSFNGIKSI
jgi:hypothetical protein